MNLKIRNKWGLGAVLALVLTGCGAPGTGFDNPFTVPLTMTFTPGNVSIVQGASSHVAVTVATAQGIEVASTLSAQSVAGVTVTPDASGLGVQVAAETTPGTYGVPVTATAGSGKATGTLTVTVTAPQATP